MTASPGQTDMLTRLKAMVMLTNTRILVVEAEFLVALDIQRMLEGADAAETAFARSIDEAVGLASRFTHFDLAIVEMPAGSVAALRLVQDLIRAEVAVVLTTTGTDALESYDLALEIVKIISKPIDEADLIAACAAALVGSRMPLSGQPSG
jgi:CheY-like chemotaxis protein